jgi:hypothetical protein
MAIFSIEIADSDIERVLNAVAANYNRPDFLDDETENPESKAQFANRIVRQFLRENVVAYEKRVAKQQLEESLNTNIDINDPYV